MTHVWLRAEQKNNERRVCLTHEGARALVSAGIKLSVEQSASRILDTQGYRDAGAEIVAENSWPAAPADAIILGLKELPSDTAPLTHKHIMFGHAYKGQKLGKALLDRFRLGNGVLYDLEYLLNEKNQRIAAFGYWAGFAGAAVALKAWIAQQKRTQCLPINAYSNQSLLVREIQTDLLQSGVQLPRVLVIGALGRVGSGAIDLCTQLGLSVTKWDIEQTRQGGPFPEVMNHDVFLNCVLATQATPPFILPTAVSSARRLSVVGDIACDPDSEYNPIPLYNQVTSWEAPTIRVVENPPLDIMAIDNLPSMLPLESSKDFSAQLLPALLALPYLSDGVWGKAKDYFLQNCKHSSIA